MLFFINFFFICRRKSSFIAFLAHFSFILGSFSVFISHFMDAISLHQFTFLHTYFAGYEIPTLIPWEFKHSSCSVFAIRYAAIFQPRFWLHFDTHMEKQTWIRKKAAQCSLPAVCARMGKVSAVCLNYSLSQAGKAMCQCNQPGCTRAHHPGWLHWHMALPACNLRI